MALHLQLAVGALGQNRDRSVVEFPVLAGLPHRFVVLDGKITALVSGSCQNDRGVWMHAESPHFVVVTNASVTHAHRHRHHSHRVNLKRATPPDLAHPPLADR